MELVERFNGTFTKRELERLIAYRAAVAAGFYTDQDGSADSAEPTPDTADLNVTSAAASAPADAAELTSGAN
jgi:hypothetical protein